MSAAEQCIIARLIVKELTGWMIIETDALVLTRSGAVSLDIHSRAVSEAS